MSVSCISLVFGRERSLIQKKISVPYLIIGITLEERAGKSAYIT